MMAKRPKRPDQCGACGGFDFVDAVDNAGQKYRGCARCRIKTPAEIAEMLAPAKSGVRSAAIELFALLTKEAALGGKPSVIRARELAGEIVVWLEKGGVSA